jgi:TRAP-type mannitol/chloroaromatic compound transport system permease small subunit
MSCQKECSNCQSCNDNLAYKKCVSKKKEDISVLGTVLFFITILLVSYILFGLVLDFYKGSSCAVEVSFSGSKVTYIGKSI